MKMNKSIILLPIAAILLNGCSTYKTISSDDFISYLNDAEASVSVESSNLNNVRISNALNVEQFNYKEGEFYYYNYFVFALILPIASKEVTWKENGKFYHYTYSSITGKTTDTEITEEQFNTYMLGHKAKISAELLKPYTTSKAYIAGTDEGYLDYTVKCQKSGLNYRMVASKKGPSTSDSSKTVTYTTTITFANKLPKKWENKGEGKSYWDYNFGDAKLVNPHENTNNNSNE